MKKENKKQYLKNNIISFVIGTMIFGAIGIYAVVTFPSNEVSYDNTSSGLSSTNVKDAIDELYKSCNKTLASQIIEIAGLEKDPYECRYFFTGANPNNYITFNNETAGWRIISAECDGTIKIMHMESIGKIAWDTTNSNDWTRPATLNTYLNNTYYNSLISATKEQIVSHNFSIGYLSNVTNLNAQIYGENSKTWNGKVALPTVSEYIRTNSNQATCSLDNLTDNSSICKRTNWMYSNYNWWTLTYYYTYSTNVHAASLITNNNTIAYSNVPNQNSIRPVVYLSSDIKITGGTGTQSDPYTIQ